MSKENGKHESNLKNLNMLRRPALNNVTNTTDSTIQTFGKVLRQAKSRLQNSRMGSSLNTNANTANAVSRVSGRISHEDKENQNPLGKIDEGSELRVSRKHVTINEGQKVIGFTVGEQKPLSLTRFEASGIASSSCSSSSTSSSALAVDAKGVDVNAKNWSDSQDSDRVNAADMATTSTSNITTEVVEKSERERIVDDPVARLNSTGTTAAASSSSSNATLDPTIAHVTSKKTDNIPLVNDDQNCNTEMEPEDTKKRPISTVVEQTLPKKFKVCEKGKEYEWEDLDEEDINDPFMVSEYVSEIFEYLHRLEMMTLPNRHDLFKHANIQQNRDILVNWMVKIHNKFGLLPETLYLALNIMDRFLCKELVQLEKLQLVGTACLFIASKYEEVYSPSVKHFSYETDGACDEEEIKEGEKFILKSLEFNLNYPNPMNFLRRISKADDYDIQSRTLAKYLLEISVVDFRFIGILPSLCAAASMFLSRKMLGKGKWDGNLIHYSGGYTKDELAPVCNMIMEYLVQPVVHDELFKKYASRRFMKASVISRQWAKKVLSHNYDIMTLHDTD